MCCRWGHGSWVLGRVRYGKNGPWQNHASAGTFQPLCDRFDADTNVSAPPRLRHNASALAASRDRTIVSTVGVVLVQAPSVVKCWRALPSWFSSPLN